MQGNHFPMSIRQARAGKDGLRRAALVVGSMLAGMILRLAGSSGAARTQRTLARELAGLRRRLLGIDRDTIGQTLGPPVITVLVEASGISGALMENAEIWYHPMSHRAVLVIGFHHNVVRQIDFLDEPMP